MGKQDDDTVMLRMGEPNIEEKIRGLLYEIEKRSELREGVRGTPGRVARSYQELFKGYSVTKEQVERMLTTFDETENYDEIVLLKGIELYSTCEHHMLPFYGQAHVAYLPDRCVVGISKLARLVEVYSRRLQIQERIGQQVVNALDKYLKPRGSICIIEAKHLCMMARGVNKQNTEMLTSSISGVFKKDSTMEQKVFSMVFTGGRGN